MKSTIKLIALISIIFIGLSCKKTTNPLDLTVSCDKDATKAPATEVAYLKNYLATNGITATEDPNGYFYIIDSVGTGDKIKRCNTITCNYKATLLDGGYIDHGNSAVLPLHQLIKGWQQGLTHVGLNSKITLYLPPSLAYGASGSSPAIGPNEYLKFVVSVSKIENTNP